MSKQYRPGSMGAAEQKSRKNFLIGAGVVYALILALFFVIPSYPKDWAARAPFIANFLGTVLVLASYAGLVFPEKVSLSDKSPIAYNIVLFLLLVFGVATIAGFNFDFVNIVERP